VAPACICARISVRLSISRGHCCAGLVTGADDAGVVGIVSFGSAVRYAWIQQTNKLTSSFIERADVVRHDLTAVVK